MPALIERLGCSRVPGKWASSEPLSETKTAAPAVPSIPSQFVSSKPGSGRSAFAAQLPGAGVGTGAGAGAGAAAGAGAGVVAGVVWAAPPTLMAAGATAQLLRSRRSRTRRAPSAQATTRYSPAGVPAGTASVARTVTRRFARTAFVRALATFTSSRLRRTSRERSSTVFVRAARAAPLFAIRSRSAVPSAMAVAAVAGATEATRRSGRPAACAPGAAMRSTSARAAPVSSEVGLGFMVPGSLPSRPYGGQENDPPEIWRRTDALGAQYGGQPTTGGR